MKLQLSLMPAGKFWSGSCLKASALDLHLLSQKSVEGLWFVARVIFIHFNYANPCRWVVKKTIIQAWDLEINLSLDPN